MKKIFLKTILCVSAMLFSLMIQAKNETQINPVKVEDEEVLINPLNGEIEFDGMVTEAAWRLNESFNLYSHFPVFNSPTAEESQVFITFDENYLWIGAILHYNDISNLVSTSKKRDEESGNSDAFGILLDSYNDNENALGFFTMPSGLKIDYTVTNDAQPTGRRMETRNFTWNSFWDVKTTVSKDSWQVEMRIPFSSLRFQSINDITKMGLLINRTISYCNEIDTYPAIDTKHGRSAFIRPSLGKTIVLKNVHSRNPIYISPYAIGGTTRTYELNEPETKYIKDDAPELTGGLDVKYNVNNNLTLDFTVNTDFAQVEADDEQLNLTRYSLYLPEKRLFFQERAGIFSYDLGSSQNLFYSRNIGIVDDEPAKILGGARLVGRVGKWDMGFLDMNTQKAGEYSAENFGVARIRKQVINENSYVGGMLTSRIGYDGTTNFAYGVDGIFKVSEFDYLDVKLAQTEDNQIRSNSLSLDPTYLSVGLEHRSQQGIVYRGKYAYWGKDFEPDAGFVLLNSIHEANATLGYGWYPGENSKLYSIYAGVDYEMTSRLEDGKIESMQINPEFSLSFKSGLMIFTSLINQREGVLEEYELADNVDILAGDYSFYSFRGMISTPRTKRIYTRLTVNTGEYYDGNRFSVIFAPNFNISSSIQLSATYQYAKVDFASRDQSFTNNIARLKGTYMFNTKLSASAYVQVNELDNIFLTNFRLRYNPRDGNDFYVVLNDLRDLDKDGYIPELPIYQSRSILLKYTHTFIL